MGKYNGAETGTNLNKQYENWIDNADEIVFPFSIHRKPTEINRCKTGKLVNM